MTEILTARQAAERLKGKRQLIDGACQSGALKATDLSPDSSRRSWRITEPNFLAWVEAGCPRSP